MSHDENPVTKDVASSPQENAGIPPQPSPDQPAAEARERILRTAYELFHRDGVTAVGVDRIVAKAGVAKTTLYRHFRSKDDLVVAVLERHEELWTSGWLELEVDRHATSPQERLPMTFDVLDEWLQGPTALAFVRGDTAMAAKTDVYDIVDVCSVRSASHSLPEFSRASPAFSASR